MSYCRWSSDDFQCDVYVYESNEGYVTHVAAARHVYVEPLPPDVPFETEAWLARHHKVMAMVERAERQPIGLVHDGETFVDETPTECAERLESLRMLGYLVPQYAIDALRQEASE